MLNFTNENELPNLGLLYLLQKQQFVVMSEMLEESDDYFISMFSVAMSEFTAHEIMSVTTFFTRLRESLATIFPDNEILSLDLDPRTVWNPTTPKVFELKIKTKKHFKTFSVKEVSDTLDQPIKTVIPTQLVEALESLLSFD